MKFIKDNIVEIVISIIIIVTICALVIAIRLENKKDKFKVTITLEPQQLERLNEIAKKDFRDAKYTLLMLVDQYIEYNENVKNDK